jgi:outer membrane protein assembly factor BamE (lipoprotein component of BamABCDE complex)
MYRFAAILLLSVLPACVVGYSSTNEPLDPELVQKLVPGKTTAKEVVELLGAPTEVVQLGRSSAYRYDHTVTKAAGLILVVVILGNLDSRADRLWVFFDEHAVLTHLGSTFASHHTQYAMPWEDVHEPEDNASRDLERKGLQGKQP